MTSGPFMNQRNKRPWLGWDLAINLSYIIKAMSHGIYICASETTVGRLYTVNLPERRCDCPDWLTSNGYADCKHLYACDFRFGALSGTEPPPFNEWFEKSKRKPGRGNRWWGGKSFTQRKNAAYGQMKPRMSQLIPQVTFAAIPPQCAPTTAGKPPVPQRDVATAILSKIDNRKSLRAMPAYIQELLTAGSITRSFHYNVICRAMGDPALTPLLHRVFVETTKPFRDISDDAAVDSSQLANASSANSVDKKTGRTRSDRPTTTWLKAHVVWSIDDLVALGYVFTWNVGKGSADEVNYSDAFEMAVSNAHIKRIAGDGSYGSDLCLADTIHAKVTPYFKLEERWNPNTKKYLTISEANDYKRFWKTDAFKQFYDRRNLAECANKVLKEVTDGFLWTRPAREQQPEQNGSPRVVPGEKIKKLKPGEITDKISPDELREIRLKARKIGTSALNECLAKLIIMNLHATVIAEQKYGQTVTYGDGFQFCAKEYRKAS